MSPVTMHPDRLRTISINTQVRRLGYLSVLLGMLRRGPCPEEFLITGLMTWSVTHASDLDDYIAPQGRIGTSRGGPRRYLELAEKLGLVIDAGGSFNLSRDGIVFAGLMERLDRQPGFALSLLEKALYLRALLEVDSDHLLCLCDLLEGKEPSLTEVQALYPDFYRERLALLLSEVQTDSARRQIGDAIKSAAAWENPRRYVEHLVPPRLAWLVDLGFINPSLFAHKKCALSEKGLRFLVGLPKLEGRPLAFVNAEWLQSRYYTSVAESLGTEARRWSELSLSEREALVTRLLGAAFNLLARPVLERAPIRQASMYVCTGALLDQVIIEEEEFLDWISAIGVVGGYIYEVRRAAREREAYLLRTKAPASNE